MVSQRVVSFLSLLVTLISQAIAKPDYQYCVCITEGGDYAPNSTYQTNLNTVLLMLTNTQNDYGFYNASYGEDPDRVYAKGLCRGDVTPHDCVTCLDNSRFLLLKQCPHQKRVAGGYDECMLHYSYRAVLGYYDSDFRVYLRNETKVTDWDEYSYVLKMLLSRLTVKAATTDSSLNRKFASGNATSLSLSSQTIYAAVQCTPDLTVAQCSDCLDGAISEIPKCCNNKLGGVVIKFTCNFRYENYRFYEPKADTLTLQLSPQGSPPASLTPSTAANYSESAYYGIITTWLELRSTILQRHLCWLFLFLLLLLLTKWYLEFFVSLLSFMTKLRYLTVEDCISQKKCLVYAGKSSKSKAVMAKYVVPVGVFVGLLIFICIYLRVRKATKYFDSKFRFNYLMLHVGVN